MRIVPDLGTLGLPRQQRVESSGAIYNAAREPDGRFTVWVLYPSAPGWHKLGTWADHVKVQALMAWFAAHDAETQAAVDRLYNSADPEDFFALRQLAEIETPIAPARTYVVKFGVSFFTRLDPEAFAQLIREMHLTGDGFQLPIVSIEILPSAAEDQPQ